MAPTRRRSTPQRIAAAAILALCLHGLAGVVLLATGAFDLPLPGEVPARWVEADQPGNETPMEVDLESLRQRVDEPEEKTEREKQVQKEEEKTRPDGQVVDIAKPAVEERPNDARYLAEYDSRVSKETKGPTGREQAGARTPQPPPMPAAPAQRPGLPGALAMREPAPRTHHLQDSSLEPPVAGPDGTIHRGDANAATPRPQPQVLPGQGGSGGLQRPNLLATDALERALGVGAGSMDYLQDLDDGESTSLNAKKWKFASFFNRVKRAVGDQWHPDTVYLRHDPSGNIYGVKDRVTVLRVSLQPNGKLAGMPKILKTSEVDFLDDEALGAFKRAEPFLNPPPQLVEPDGQIHFNFAFIFELSGKTSFKVFRY